MLILVNAIINLPNTHLFTQVFFQFFRKVFVATSPSKNSRIHMFILQEACIYVSNIWRGAFFWSEGTYTPISKHSASTHMCLYSKSIRLLRSKLDSMSKFLEQRRFPLVKWHLFCHYILRKLRRPCQIFLINSLSIKKQGRIVYLEYGAQTLDRSIGKRWPIEDGKLARNRSDHNLTKGSYSSGKPCHWLTS